MKTALITGGTRGIGRAVADCLAQSGYDLTLIYFADNEAEQIRAEIAQKFGVKVTAIEADISNEKSIDLIYNYLIENNLKLNAVVLNAGLTLRDSFEETKMSDWQKVFFANVHFPVFLLQKIVNQIVAGGSVVFTGSLMGIEPHAMSLVYGVTKSATHALVKNLVKFLAPYNIRVNGVAPGFVDTEWQKNKPAEIRKNIENKIALQRFCLPEEIAQVYKMLIENGYFNGEIIVVDGGYSYK
ncbi:MAG: SDR family oxidoreductase [Prevotellaceae bacterium]|jgi:3-oxoacyl-[acyl-carrier protein] reductase|nr:SDR family oxidoreductase [Prevotellaceae bacterium]